MAKFDVWPLVRHLSECVVTYQIMQGSEWKWLGPGAITPVPQTNTALGLEQACAGTAVCLFVSAQEGCGW